MLCAIGHFVDGIISVLAVGAVFGIAVGLGAFGSVVGVPQEAMSAGVVPLVAFRGEEGQQSPAFGGEVHLRVGFAYEGKLFALWHGSFLPLFCQPFLAGFEASLALAEADHPRPSDALDVAFHIEPVLRVGHDAVFLLFFHIISSLAIIGQGGQVVLPVAFQCSRRNAPIGCRP